MTDTTAPPSLRWVKALLNGLMAWVLGFVLYMIPAFVVAFKIGFELGPQGVESSVISSQIAQTIPQMYRESIWLSIGYAAVIALLVFWRARVVAKGTGTYRIPHGLLVAMLPVLLCLLSGAVIQMEWSWLVDAAIFCLAGYVGGRTATASLP